MKTVLTEDSVFGASTTTSDVPLPMDILWTVLFITINPSCKLTFSHFNPHISPIRIPVYRQIRILRFTLSRLCLIYKFSFRISCSDSTFNSVFLTLGDLTSAQIFSKPYSLWAYADTDFRTMKMSLTVLEDNPPFPSFRPHETSSDINALICFLEIRLYACPPKSGIYDFSAAESNLHRLIV